MHSSTAAYRHITLHHVEQLVVALQQSTYMQQTIVGRAEE